MLEIKPIAIHLPQFHPFAENDEWWGKGFTEWTNVSKAKPYFSGHYQPHLPADLGFYDLRLEEARLAQIALAKAYGIYGFCYYYYWFNGTRLMKEPLDRMLANEKEDFPFMLCWANENWSRRWDGLESQLLIKQEYSTEDDLAHIRFLCEHFFSDKRYIRVNGKPFFCIYRPDQFTDIRKTADTWRQEVSRLGCGDLYLGYFQGFNNKKPALEMGLDCGVDFQPDFFNLSERKFSLKSRIRRKLHLEKEPYDFKHSVYSYEEYSQKAANDLQIKPDIYPGISPMWDNAARRQKGATILSGSTPELYGKWLQAVVDKYKDQPLDNKFLFINAWNEWAEGNHLEPCAKWGKQYLEVTKQVLSAS